MSLLFNMLSRLVIAFLPRSESFEFHDCSHLLQWFWSARKQNLSLFPLFPPLFAMKWWDRKRPWCWQRLKAGEGNDWGWDGWIASLIQWTWVWESSGSWWWTGKMAHCSPWGCIELDTTERLKWTELNGRKQRGTKEPLDEGERRKWESWLKTQHSEN